MSEDDLVSLASGGTINGIKLNKIQKREIKHAI
jgi:hypothetical protein